MTWLARLWRAFCARWVAARDPLDVEDRMPDPDATMPVPEGMRPPGQATHARMLRDYPDAKEPKP